MKLDVNMTNLIDENLYWQVMKKAGIQPDKLSYVLKKYHNQYIPKEINYINSKHCSQMQQGNCLIIQHLIDDLDLDQLMNKTETA